MGLGGLTSVSLREVFQQLTHGVSAATLLEAMQGHGRLTLQRAAELPSAGWRATYDVVLEVSLPSEARRFRSATGYLRALQPHVDAPDTAVIIAFTNRYTAHRGVVRRIECADPHMRDSDGLSVRRTTGFAVGTGRRHIRPADTIVIRRAG